MQSDGVDHPRRVGLDLIGGRGEYGGHAREAVIRRLQPPLGRVLDVGCGEGANAPALRASGATYLAGIEMSSEFAGRARDRYDDVVAGSIEDADLPWEPGSLDLILCYDVLEHLYDPWSVLRRLRPLLRPGGRLHVSIPNARNTRVWWPLAVRGTFTYAPAGLMDVTHIRFFGRRDAVEMLEATGFEVASVDGAQSAASIKRRLAVTLTGGRAAEFYTVQWHLPARRPTQES